MKGCLKIKKNTLSIRKVTIWYSLILGISVFLSSEVYSMARVTQSLQSIPSGVCELTIETATKLFICSGALVDNKLFTAKHCFTNVKGGKLTKVTCSKNQSINLKGSIHTPHLTKDLEIIHLIDNYTDSLKLPDEASMEKYWKNYHEGSDELSSEIEFWGHGGTTEYGLQAKGFTTRPNEKSTSHSITNTLEISNEGYPLCGDSGCPLIKRSQGKNYIMGIHHQNLERGNSILKSYWINLTQDSIVDWIKESEERVFSIREHWEAFTTKKNIHRNKLYSKLLTAQEFSDFFIPRANNDNPIYIRSLKKYLNKKVKFFIDFNPNIDDTIHFLNTHINYLEEKNIIDFFDIADISADNYNQWEELNIIIEKLSKNDSLKELTDILEKRQSQSILKIDLSIHTRQYLIKNKAKKPTHLTSLVESYLSNISYEHELIFLLETLYDIKIKDKRKIPKKAISSIQNFIQKSYKALPKEFTPESCAVTLGNFFTLKKIQKSLFNKVLL